jgi:hypothetical protein
MGSLGYCLFMEKLTKWCFLQVNLPGEMLVFIPDWSYILQIDGYMECRESVLGYPR